jgi:tetratricopeptide (TPR) repeat protein
LRLGATDKALRAYQKGLELSEALARDDPNNTEVKRDLSISYEKFGDVQLRLEATDKALRAYQKGLDLREALARDDPNNAQAQADLSTSFVKIARAHEQARDLVPARENDERSLAVDQKLSDRLPRSADARRGVALDCERLSKLCGRAGDWIAAVNYARQAIEHARAARAIAGDDQPFQWEFSITLRFLGYAQLGAGQAKEARQSFEEAVQANPRSFLAYNDLAWLLATCWDEAVRDGKKAITAARQACELTEWKNPLFLDTLAATYAEAGQFAEAVEWQKKAVAAPDSFDKQGLEQAKERLKLYESSKSYHEPRPEPAPGPGRTEKGNP